MLRNLSPERRARVERQCVIAFLVFECLPDLSEEVIRAIEEHHKLSPVDITRRQIKAIPTEDRNMMIAHDCLARYGPDLLQASSMFYGFTRRGPCDYCEGRDLCCCDLETWRLDIDPRLSKRGIVVPVLDRRSGFFDDLLVFRHAQDDHPFILKVRANTEAAA